jgi:hypothetical protein
MFNIRVKNCQHKQKNTESASVNKTTDTFGQLYTAAAYRVEGSLVVLQVNCRSIYNKALELWNLVDTYNPDVVVVVVIGVGGGCTH